MGNIYIAGYTTAPDFPVTSGALQAMNAGPYSNAVEVGVIPGGDVFIAKLNPDGSLGYSTFLGGSGNDVPTAISVDSAGAIYVAGYTTSTNFPLTSSPVSNAPSQGFVVKINPVGSALDFSTYFPAGINALALDSDGAVYLTGTAGGGLITTPGAVQTMFGGHYLNGFAAKISASGSSLTYSTYLGGLGTDIGYAVAVDSRGAAWIGGQTQSASFPGTTGTGDAFLIKLAPDGSAVQIGSRFGAGPPLAGSTTFVAVDAQDNVYASGGTGAFPASSASVFQPTPNAQLSLACAPSGGSFLIEAGSDGTQIYASYLRRTGMLFLTAPSHLLVYGTAVSTLDLTSTPAMNFTCPVNSASYTVPIAPGEIVSLFGYGIGPQIGVGANPMPTVDSRPRSRGSRCNSTACPCRCSMCRRA